MSTIEMIEYVYESTDELLEISFKCFPHLSTNDQVLTAIQKYFKMDVRERIREDFNNDAYLAFTYTLATELHKMRVLMRGEGVTANIMERMQNHIKKDLRLSGVYLNWINLHNDKLYVKHDGLIY